MREKDQEIERNRKRARGSRKREWEREREREVKQTRGRVKYFKKESEVARERGKKESEDKC